MSEQLWAELNRKTAQLYSNPSRKRVTLVREIVLRGLQLPRVDIYVPLDQLDFMDLDERAEAGGDDRRKRVLQMQISPMLRDGLKEAAAATRPDRSRRLGSASRVVRELLRQAFGMRSKDDGVTLQRLDAWKRSADFDSPPTPEPTDEELQRDLTDYVSQLPKYRRFKRYQGYYRDRVKGALPTYKKLIKRYRRGLPVAEARKTALNYFRFAMHLMDLLDLP